MSGKLIRNCIAALARLGVALVVLGVVGTPALRAQNQDGTWTASVGGSWVSPLNWQGGFVADGAGQTASFLLDLNPNASVTLDGDRTIGTVVSAGANAWNLDSGTPASILTTAGITVNGAGPLTVTAQLAGVDLVKDGVGTLIVSNPNGNYTGTVNVNAGTLQLTGSGNYATGAGTMHVASGATLDVSGLTAGARYGGDPSTRMAVNDGDTLTGTGRVIGGIRVKSGGTVYPGDFGIGTLTVVPGGGNFAAGSTWKVKLLTNPSFTVGVSNNINFGNGAVLSDGMNMVIDGNGQTFISGRTYDYFIADSAVGPFTIGNVNFQPTNFDPGALPADFSLSTSGSHLMLRYTPVPEPSFVMAILLVIIFSVTLRRVRSTS